MTEPAADKTSSHPPRPSARPFSRGRRPAPELIGPVCVAYTPRERFADACVHVAGISLGLICLIVLLAVVAPQYDWATGASLAVYGVAAVTVFVLSAAYNMVQHPEWKPRLRRLDRAAIYLKIAGTYTPFSAVVLGGGVGFWLLSASWFIAAIGVPLSIWASERLERVAVWLYLAQGWLLVLVIEPIRTALPAEAVNLILIGGSLYTVGVVFHLSERLPYHNAIWHAFVLAASGFMFAGVLAAMPAPIT